MKTSPSKAEQIRKIFTDTPSVTSKQVAEMTGFPLNMVYQVKYQMNKKKPVGQKKPVGRPRKVKKVVVTRAEIASNAYLKLQTEHSFLLRRTNDLTNEIDRLEQEADGFRAVISYLEHRLGWESSQ
jgi:hypothetical protein